MGILRGPEGPLFHGRGDRSSTGVKGPSFMYAACKHSRLLEQPATASGMGLQDTVREAES
jgi:hypothetical protein